MQCRGIASTALSGAGITGCWDVATEATSEPVRPKQPQAVRPAQPAAAALAASVAAYEPELVASVFTNIS
jgi:hypothetical protein